MFFLKTCAVLRMAAVCVPTLQCLRGMCSECFQNYLHTLSDNIRNLCHLRIPHALCFDQNDVFYRNICLLPSLSSPQKRQLLLFFIIIAIIIIICSPSWADAVCTPKEELNKFDSTLWTLC